MIFASCASPFDTAQKLTIKSPAQNQKIARQKISIPLAPKLLQVMIGVFP